MTNILQVITEYCSIYVDDIRLSDLAQTNPPLYARRMWAYFKPAISLFNLPVSMPEYLIGTPDAPMLTEPAYASNIYTTTEEYNSVFTVQLGAEYANYELFNCALKTYDNLNNVIYTPVSAVYNKEDGSVEITPPADTSYPAGSLFDMDFYTDGSFQNTLSAQIMNILGMCFQVVWQDRFNTDWLSMVSKVEDRSFYEQNRANKVRADTERLEMLRRKLAGEMRRYEQNLYFKKTIPEGENLPL